MSNSYEPVFPTLTPGPSGAGRRSSTRPAPVARWAAQRRPLPTRRRQPLWATAADLALWAFAVLIGISPLA
jgi:hypothetical protein